MAIPWPMIARYRDRDWNAIEADARRDWAQNHKDSAWEDFKDAVRYSWEPPRRPSPVK